MHADIEQLLSLRDGETVDAAAAQHVRDCVECNARLARMNVTKLQLQSLPAVVGSHGDDWHEIERRIARRNTAPMRRARTAFVAAAAGVATLTVLAGLRLQDRAGHRADAFSDLESAVIAVDPPTIEELQYRSMQLEQLLAALPERPAVERAATALPIEALEAQVQWVDHRLSESGAARAAPEETEQLWRDRIELMNSLVQLRSVEAQRLTL